MSRWSSDSLDKILWQGDKLNSIKKTNDLLQVNNIGPQINAFKSTYNFHIGHEFFRRIRRHQSDSHIGSTLENATFSVICGKKICVLEMKKVVLHHYYLYHMNIVTFLIQTVETHMAYLLTVEHLNWLYSKVGKILYCTFV